MKNFVPSILSLAIIFSIWNWLIDPITIDFATSVVPGWHTTIYPSEYSRATASLTIMAVSAANAFLFLLLRRLFSYLINVMQGKAKQP